ncbi:hypothetical protein GCM10027443_21100 [Pontibacter brevis]
MTIIERLELPFLHIYYQKDLRVLFCRWRMPVELPEFSEGYMAALRFAAQQDAHFWLQDLRLRNTSCEKQRDCFMHTFVPTTSQVLRGSNFIAYLMSPLQREALVQQDATIKEPVSFGVSNKLIRHSDFLTVRYFTSEHDALEWLNECRYRFVA